MNNTIFDSNPQLLIALVGYIVGGFTCIIASKLFNSDIAFLIFILFPLILGFIFSVQEGKK